MARASTGRAKPGKVKAAGRQAVVVPAQKTKSVVLAAPKKKAGGALAKKIAVAAPKKKVVAVKKPVAAPKMAAAVRKAGAAKTAVVAKQAGVAASPAAAAPRKAGRAPAKPVVAVKKTTPRRAGVRPAVAPTARRGRPVPRKAAPAVRVVPPQVFTVSHLNQDDFKVDGLRTYARYRDLGMAAATGGLCQAHVIRFTPPCTDEVRKRHLHQTELQLVYVLQGWMKNEFEGHGEQMMSAGSCWLQPSGIKHTVLDYSPDCEVLEIIVPADFRTDELA